MRIHLTGNANVDVLMGKLAEWPQRGTETILEHYDLRVGGALGNMALALSALESNVSYYATVGNDLFGDWLRAQLEGHGCGLSTAPVSTALTVGLSHPDDQRTFFSYLGHLEHYDPRPLEEAIDHAAAGDLLFICGYFLMPRLRERTAALLGRARARGLLTALDTGWPDEGWTDAVREEVTHLLPHLSLFLPNDLELQAFTQAETAEGALEALAAYPHLRTIVKLGADGAGFLDNRRYRTTPAPTVSVKDTIGAGDSFNAGLITALQRGLELHEAVSLAVNVASLAVSSSPRAYPTWQQVYGDVTLSR